MSNFVVVHNGTRMPQSESETRVDMANGFLALKSCVRINFPEAFYLKGL